MTNPLTPEQSAALVATSIEQLSRLPGGRGSPTLILYLGPNPVTVPTAPESEGS